MIFEFDNQIKRNLKCNVIIDDINSNDKAKKEIVYVYINL